MIVKNPTNVEIKVQIKGNSYTLPAKGEISGVSAADAEYWFERLHSFIVIEPEAQKVSKPSEPATSTPSKTEVKDPVTDSKTDVKAGANTAPAAK